MISMAVDTAKITKLQTKFAKYGPYAIKAGLKAGNDYLNSSDIKYLMYPPSQSGSPFVWSSEKQRRFVFATISLPSVRTMNLANSGSFKVNETSFWIEYVNSASYAKYVQHPSYQIIGHRMRGWKPVNTFVVSRSSDIVRLFKPAALAAWTEMESFMFGGGAGL